SNGVVDGFEIFSKRELVAFSRQLIENSLTHSLTIATQGSFGGQIHPGSLDTQKSPPLVGNQNAPESPLSLPATRPLGTSLDNSCTTGHEASFGSLTGHAVAACKQIDGSLSSMCGALPYK